MRNRIPYYRDISRRRRGLSLVAWLSLWPLLSGLAAPLAPPRLEFLRPAGAETGWRFSGSAQTNTVLTLERSSDMVAWQSVGVFHDAVYQYPEASAGTGRQGFYRLTAAFRGPVDDWKNQIGYPLEAFLSTNATTDVRWVKFALLLNDPGRVYYQDSAKYPLHYDFAARRLAPFMGMDYGDFERISLHRANQQVVLGSVLFQPSAGEYAPGTVFAEVGVQFDGVDLYPPEDIARWFARVKATLCASNGTMVYYMPTFEQREMTRTNADAFAVHGVPVASVERWIKVSSCYSPGWAFGRLKYLPAAEISAAFADGRLRPEDVLLTDGVPADTPVLAGIVTLTPATPNSHTAILTRSFGIPFAYLADPEDRAAARALDGHEVLVYATTSSWETVIKVIDVEGQLTPDLVAQLLALKQPAPVNFAPKRSYGALSASTDILRPNDIQYFGGKAANFGLLRRAIPSNCPAAIAFSFDLWDAFLDQHRPGGRTLRAEIATRLAPFTNYPPEIVSLKTNLAAVRELFTKTASFTPAQKQAITNALAGFNPRRNLRCRSSTNVEDAEHFTGAGLYDSFSGCLLDDLDGDDAGPCQCDATEPKERGVFRALQKVYASFYNDDAYLERLRHGIDETRVAMGVLVHPSFPDAEELANGVATPAFVYSGASINYSGDLVTQAGAVSVSNPDGSSVPEIVNTSYSWQPGSSTNQEVRLKQYSSLTPLGAPVMAWKGDYFAFLDLFAAVGSEFRRSYPAKRAFTLDFEYKKDLNLGLVIKQVRTVPPPADSTAITPFLIDEPVSCRVMQAGSSVFAAHRLKSRWTLHTVNRRLDPTNGLTGIYTEGTLDYLENGTPRTLIGPLSGWPNAARSAAGITNYWTTGSGVQRWDWELDTTLDTNVTASAPPLITALKSSRMVTVTYATPMPTVYWGSLVTNVTSETVWLEPIPKSTTPVMLQVRTLVHTNGLTVQTSYHWPKPAGGIEILFAPLLRFVETRITGLTPEPIVLTNYYSQSYSAGNHNMFEEFVFEPRLEPGLPPATLAALNAANIQLLHISTFAARFQNGIITNATFHIVGLDQTIRKL